MRATEMCCRCRWLRQDVLVTVVAAAALAASATHCCMCRLLDDQGMLMEKKTQEEVRCVPVDHSISTEKLIKYIRGNRCSPRAPHTADRGASSLVDHCIRCSSKLQQDILT